MVDLGGERDRFDMGEEARDEGSGTGKLSSMAVRSNGSFWANDPGG